MKSLILQENIMSLVNYAQAKPHKAYHTFDGSYCVSAQQNTQNIFSSCHSSYVNFLYASAYLSLTAISLVERMKTFDDVTTEETRWSFEAS